MFRHSGLDRPALRSCVAAGLLLGISGCPGQPGADSIVATDFGTFVQRTILAGGQGVGKNFSQPAYLRFGPDGRLYATTYIGSLFALTLDANHNVVAVDEHKPLGYRLLTGMAFDPWAPPTEPVLYVINNQAWIYEQPDNTDRLARLTGPDFSVATDLVVGLPRSFENHMTFALVFGPDRRLYIAQGGNTNQGMPAPGIFGNRSEQPLSAAILAADVRDPEFGGINDVEIYAPGMRNPYGLCLHSNGYMYVEDQGGNKGHGGRPDPNDPGGQIEVPIDLEDEVNVLLPTRYYGHPNPARNQLAWKADLADGTPHQPALTVLPLASVVTGIWEYDSPANGGLLLGHLLLPGFGDPDALWWVGLSADGLSATGQGILTLSTAYSNPLDVTVGPDGTIYVAEAGAPLGFGGVGPSRITVLEPVEPAVGKWSGRTAMSVARAEHAAAVLGGKVYVVGGDTPEGISSSLAAYDPATDAWTELSAKPGAAVNHPAAAGVGGKLYVFGGLATWPGPAVDEVWEYDPAKDAWTAMTQMPRARGAMAAAVYEDKVFLFGGLAGGVAVSDVAVYDPAIDTWGDLSESAPMPTARDHFAAAVSLRGLIYCIGGRQQTIESIMGTVEAFDPLERRWMTGYADMPTPRGGHAAALMHGRIVVAGGEGAASASGVFSEVEEYDPVSNTWRALTAMSAGRHGAPAVVVDRVMYVPGGGDQIGGSTTDTTLAFTFLP